MKWQPCDSVAAGGADRAGSEWLLLGGLTLPFSRGTRRGTSSFAVRSIALLCGIATSLGGAVAGDRASTNAGLVERKSARSLKLAAAAVALDACWQVMSV